MRQKTAYNQINKTVENNTCKMYNSTVDGWKKMKPYWAGLFLIALFIQVYTTDSVAKCIITNDNCASVPQNTEKEIESGKSLYCGRDADNFVFVTCTDTLPTEQTVTKCIADFFEYNGKCISCADATGEERATSEEGAIGMNDCYLPAKSNNTPNQYIDEKGTFTYSSDCTISCTDETSYLCDNASA